jgi:hypothetical protein
MATLILIQFLVLVFAVSALCVSDNAKRVEIARLRGALHRIADLWDCDGPGCYYCESDGQLEHPPTQGAVIAQAALREQGDQEEEDC